MFKTYKNILIITAITAAVFLAGIWRVSNNRIIVNEEMGQERTEKENMEEKNTSEVDDEIIKEAASASNEVISESQTQEPEIITSDIDISNWATYRNEEYGFEVKYPEEYDVREVSYPSKNKDIIYSVYFKTDAARDNDGGISIILMNMPTGGLDYAKMLDRNNCFSYGEVIINQNKFSQLTKGGKSEKSRGYHQETFFENDDRYYDIFFLSGAVIPEDVYDSFLLSFNIIK